jgi:uncharacterized coiled-coil protein SlyX
MWSSFISVLSSKQRIVYKLSLFKERKIQELNDSLAKNSNELVEQKIQETTRLESEIKHLKEKVSNLESEKINSDNSKNNHISELVSFLALLFELRFFLNFYQINKFYFLFRKNKWRS